MKFISIVLGLLVIISWLFVLREYQHGHEQTEKGKLVIIIACILTFIMTLINTLDYKKTAPHNEVLLFYIFYYDTVT